MTTKRDTTTNRPPTPKQAAFLARLRDKGLGLAPLVDGGRVVRSRPLNKDRAGAGALGAPVADLSRVGASTRSEPVRPAERRTAVPGEVFELVIPAPRPFLNANTDKKLHWAPLGERVKAWRRTAHMCAQTLNLPRGLARVQIDAYVIKPRANRFDPANWAPTAKAVVDGLVDYGLTVDDDRHHVAGPFMHDGGKGPNSLRVIITPVAS